MGLTDAGLIAMSLISLAGMILLFTLNNSQWFKKENFKIQKSNVMAENRLNLRKLEKDLGLKHGKAAPEEKGILDKIGGLADLLPLLKNLDQDQISGLIDKFIGGGSGGEDYDEEDGVGMLMDFAGKNPDVVKGLLEGITKGSGGQNPGGNVY